MEEWMIAADVLVTKAGPGTIAEVLISSSSLSLSWPPERHPLPLLFLLSPPSHALSSPRTLLSSPSFSFSSTCSFLVLEFLLQCSTSVLSGLLLRPSCASLRLSSRTGAPVRRKGGGGHVGAAGGRQCNLRGEQRDGRVYQGRDKGGQQMPRLARGRGGSGPDAAGELQARGEKQHSSNEDRPADVGRDLG
eukprot:759272-Hanusia_phi.AAC.1